MAIFDGSRANFDIKLDPNGYASTWGALSSVTAWERIVTTATNTITYDLYSNTQVAWTGSSLTYGDPYFDNQGNLLTDITGGTLKTMKVIDGEGNLRLSLSGFSWNPAATGQQPTLSLLLGGADTITGGAGNDVLYAFNGNDIIKGGAGDDTIVGGAGADNIDGGTGFDIASFADQSSAINVTLGTTGNGTVTLATGNDTLANIEGLIGGSGADILTGNALNNYLEGGLGLDKLDGGAGIDRISFASNGISSVNLDMTTGKAQVTEVGNVITETAINFENAVGSAGADTITGTAGANYLEGGAGNDTLNGGDGNDTLVGGLGFDTLNGGAGNDYYVADMEGGYVNGIWTYAYDKVIETSTVATEIDTVELRYNSGYSSAGMSYQLQANVENLVLQYSGYGSAVAAGNSANNVITAQSGLPGYYSSSFAFKLYGGAGNDTITTGAGSDYLNGGTGNDRLTGGAGNDTYVIDSASDSVIEASNGGTDTIISGVSISSLAANVENVRLSTTSTATSVNGNALNNAIYGNEAVNVLSGLGGDDYISAGEGNDKVYGGDGSDMIVGGLGDDTLDGGANGYAYGPVTDWAYPAPLGDTVSFQGSAGSVKVDLNVTTAQNTGAGLDTLLNFESVFGGNAADTLSGNAVANTLRGYSGNDTLSGRAGDDYLIGDAGNDLLTGGAGADRLYGGAGADRFVFDTRESYYVSDQIVDFESDSDKLLFKMSAFKIGNGNTVVDSGIKQATTGGFSANAEVVIFTQNTGYPYSTPSAFDAASTIGSASTSYAVGDQRLFVVDSGTRSGVYLFTSSGADNAVSAGELQLVGSVENTAELNVSDFMFA